jgi:glycosyl transferase, family 25
MFLNYIDNMELIIKKTVLIMILFVVIITFVYIEKSKMKQYSNAVTNTTHRSKNNSSNRNNSIVESFSNKTETMNVLDKIDKILFINLKHRKDRLEQINNEFDKMNFPTNKIERIDAVNAKFNGHIGCCKSHIKTMKHIMKHNYKYTLVFEDDFVFKVDQDTFNKKVDRFLKDYKDDWDMIQLASGYVSTEDTDNDDVKRVKHSSTSSAYIINRHFAPILLEDLETSLSLMEKDMEEFIRNNNNVMKKKFSTQYALDQRWYKLQKKSKWYLFKPYLGRQGGEAGKSSILNKKLEGFLASNGYKVTMFKLAC